MGSYPGVGIEVAAEDGAVKILRPIDGSPAQKAGLLPGDHDREDRRRGHRRGSRRRHREDAWLFGQRRETHDSSPALGRPGRVLAEAREG